MKKQVLILHVGMPKTASSALQTFLHQNRDLLNLQNCEYGAVSSDTAMPKHQYLVNDLITKKFVETEKTLTYATKDTLILSTEGLSNHLYDFKPDALATFRNMTRKFEIRLFVVLRSPLDWAKSYYKQAVINPSITMVDYYATPLVFSEFLKIPRIQKLMDHKSVTDDLLNSFAGDRITTAEFKGDWLQAFMQTADLQCDTWTPVQRVNESPPNWTIEILRQVNRATLPEQNRVAWKAILQSFENTNHVLLNSAANRHGTQTVKLDKKLVQALVPTSNDNFSLTEEQLHMFQDFLARKNYVI